MSMRRILIDAGNTRLKWAVIEAGTWHSHGHADYTDLTSLHKQLQPGSACHIASVASKQHEEQIAASLAPFLIEPEWMKSTAQFADLKNGYAEPQQLGVDRWMGLIAARRRSKRAVLVVSMGTAMTVDAISAEGNYLGGLIVPGLHLMRQGLLQGTACVTEGAGSFKPFPLNTADGVESGIMSALCGAIDRQCAHIAAITGVEPVCFMTGGDAAQVASHLTLTIESVPLLILEGIAAVALEGKKE